MAQSQPTRLLTTRWRAGVAVGLTACVFALAVRDVLLRSHRRSLLIPRDSWLHGWPLVAANVLFYGYLCWLAFLLHSRPPRARAGFYGRMVLSGCAFSAGSFAAWFHRRNQVHLCVHVWGFRYLQ